MLDHETTMEYIARAKTGDEHAKTELITHNMPLIKSIAKRYRNTQIDYDDLIQLGSLGFVKAINHFDPTFNVRFSTYAVPMIAGEIKRFIRDDGAIKVGRVLKTLCCKMQIFISKYTQEHGEAPTVDVLSQEFGVDRQEIVFALDSNKYPVSLFEKFDDDNDRCVMDKLSSPETGDDMVDKIMLKEVIAALPERERTIIVLRYFRDKTQSEIASIMGVSQVQISRIESKVIATLRQAMAE